MDSREIHQQQQQQHQHHQLHHQQQQQQPPHGLLMSHNNSFNRNPNAAVLMGPTTTSRLPFGSISPHQPQHPLHLHHHHHPQPQQQQQIDQKTLESLGFDGSQPSSVARFGIDQQQQQQNQQQQAKKKRGRPRKYVDNNIGLGLTPTSPASNSYGGGTDVGGGGDGGGGGANVNSSDPPVKRNRGRPPGSGKKQLDALGGTGGVGFTPHVIEVNSGEDIAMKVMAFTNQGPRAICILSAVGAVSNVMIRQGPPSSNGAAVKYEGRYDIINLSGSFLNTESNGSVSKTGNLKVTLGGADGRIVAGSVAGMLVAGSQVQVVVGSFVADGKKQKLSPSLAQNTPEPASAPANMLSFGGNGGPGSPRSQVQQHSSDTSEENESNSSLHRGNNNNNHGLFGNSTPQQQPIHQIPMQMYHLWPTNNPQ